MFKNIKIFFENNKIMKNKFYLTFQNRYEISEINTSNSEFFPDINLVPKANRTQLFKISENYVNLPTIDCIINLRENNPNSIITALNFANAFIPGGAYIFGGDAQEESLCRASTLFYTLKKDFYFHNMKRPIPLYRDGMIYSSNVTVFRNHLGDFLEPPIKCDFITSPAVNKNFARFIFSKKKINSVMQNRINKIVSLAISKNSNIIVLGAFGCGVFGNKRDDVLPMIENAVNEFVPDDVKVVFASI